MNSLSSMQGFRLKALVSAMGLISGVAHAADAVVTNLDDSGLGSLRDAMTIVADDGGQPSTITFAAGLTGSIALASSLPQISDSLTLEGAGITLQAAAVSGQVFDVRTDDAQASVALKGLAISNAGGRAIYAYQDSSELLLSGVTISGSAAGSGGSVRVRYGDLSVVDSVITDNANGAIDFARGDSFTLSRSRVENNSTSEGRGGIRLYYADNFQISDSVISGNSGDRDGGGLAIIYSDGSITASEISNNQSTVYGSGGGIFVDSSSVLTISNSVIAGNVAESGGGAIRATDGAQLTIQSSTISGNRVEPLPGKFRGGYGGAIDMSFDYDGAGSLRIFDSIIEGNVATKQGGALALRRGSINAVIERTRIANNEAGSGGAFDISSFGGTISVFIRQSVISGNSAGRAAIGNIYLGYNVVGSVTLEDLTIEGHSSDGNGGLPETGLSVRMSDADFTIDRSTISGNQAGREVLTFTGRSFASNAAPRLNILNSTVSGNSAAVAQAAILLRGMDATVTHSTFVNNAATLPDGVSLASAQLAAHGNDPLEGELNVQRSVFSSVNNVEVIVGGPVFLSDSLSIGSSDTITGSITDVILASGLGIDPGPSTNVSQANVQEVSPQLAALADRGGFNLVHEPLSIDSPAVDQGDADPRPGSRDQRGVGGIVGPFNDLGAVEFVDPTVNTPPRLIADLPAQLAGSVGTAINISNLADAFVDDQAHVINVNPVWGLPAGLTFNSESGSVSGTLSAAGTYYVTVLAGDNGQPPMRSVSRFTVEVTASEGGDGGDGGDNGGDTGSRRGGDGSVPLGFLAVLAFMAALRRRV